MTTDHEARARELLTGFLRSKVGWVSDGFPERLTDSDRELVDSIAQALAETEAAAWDAAVEAAVERIARRCEALYLDTPENLRGGVGFEPWFRQMMAEREKGTVDEDQD